MITKKSYLMVLLCGVAMLSTRTVFAGNEDRSGQAGASELLINPWARSAGWGGSNAANSRGIEATYMNVAGIAFVPKTEVAFSNTMWLKGTDIRINSFGLAQKLGESTVIGVSMMSMNFGDVDITTTDIPEGGIGKYSPRMMNFGLSYARAFSSTIYGGVNIKGISEGISNATAQGIALDAGIQYVTGIGLNKEGKKYTDNLKFGIALKNVGPPIRYTGDGLSFRGIVVASGTTLTVQHRSEHFELPSLVNIGASYDYIPADKLRLTFAGTYTSNSFSKDAYQLGTEFAYLNYFMLRVGYYLEKKSKSLFMEPVTSIYSGPSTGFTLNIPFGKGITRSFALDYSVRFTTKFENIHSFGARVNL